MVPLLSKQACASIIGISPVSLMRLVRLGHFPRPIKLHPGTNGRVRFSEPEVRLWLEQRKVLANRERRSPLEHHGRKSGLRPKRNSKKPFSRENYNG